jgi:hypothetical protein
MHTCMGDDLQLRIDELGAGERACTPMQFGSCGSMRVRQVLAGSCLKHAYPISSCRYLERQKNREARANAEDENFQPADKPSTAEPYESEVRSMMQALSSPPCWPPWLP